MASKEKLLSPHVVTYKLIVKIKDSLDFTVECGRDVDKARSLFGSLKYKYGAENVSSLECVHYFDYSQSVAEL